MSYEDVFSPHQNPQAVAKLYFKREAFCCRLVGAIPVYTGMVLRRWCFKQLFPGIEEWYGSGWR